MRTVSKYFIVLHIGSSDTCVAILSPLFCSVYLCHWLCAGLFTCLLCRPLAVLLHIIFFRFFVPSFVLFFVLRFFVPFLLRSFVPSSLRPLAPSSPRPLVPSSLRPFVPSSLRPFVPNFLCFFVPSFLLFSTAYPFLPYLTRPVRSVRI